MENEEAIAEMFYTVWAADGDRAWGTLAGHVQGRWLSLTRFVLHMEIELASKIVNDRLRERIAARIGDRIKRWEKDRGSKRFS